MRNEITLVVLNLLGIGIFLYYFAIIAKYKGFQIDYLKVVILIIGVLMILIGNFLPQMPFRSRIGFKLPWILKDKLCWQKHIDLQDIQQFHLVLSNVCLFYLFQTIT